VESEQEFSEYPNVDQGSRVGLQRPSQLELAAFMHAYILDSAPGWSC
jgi:hypothetical protein